MIITRWNLLQIKKVENQRRPTSPRKPKSPRRPKRPKSQGRPKSPESKRIKK